MITVKLFARIREDLGVGELSLPVADSVRDLRDTLCKERGSRWADALLSPQVIIAVNQQVAALDDQLSDGDEVAFFPPVTGG